MRPDETGPVPEQFRRLLTRAEAAVLLGMLLVVGSLFLTWESHTLTVPLPALLAGKQEWRRNGFGTTAWQPLTLCSVLAATLLMWTVSPRNRLPVLLTQIACGLSCVVIALARFALLPGVLIGLTGGALLMAGALDRFLNTESRHSSG